MFHVKHKAVLCEMRAVQTEICASQDCKREGRTCECRVFLLHCGPLQRIAFDDYENAGVDSVILAHVDLFNAN